MAKSPKGYNKHHVIFKKNNGAGIPNNRKLMRVEDHNSLHWHDDHVDDKIVFKDEEYYQYMYEWFNKQGER